MTHFLYHNSFLHKIRDVIMSFYRQKIIYINKDELLLALNLFFWMDALR